MLAADIAVVLGRDGAAFILLDSAALAHPRAARTREALLDIDHHIGIGVGAGGVVNRQSRLAGGFAERNLSHGHAQAGSRIGPRVYLARRRQSSGRDLGRRDIGVVNIHVLLPWADLSLPWRERIASSCGAPGMDCPVPTPE